MRPVRMMLLLLTGTKGRRVEDVVHGKVAGREG
jgi:hypothetical protein